jgi:hypothetical protein
MKYYYHEKERLNALFKNVKKVKVPVTVFLRDRNKITLKPVELGILSSFVGDNDKKIKQLFSSENIVKSALMGVREKFKQINKINRRKK